MIHVNRDGNRQLEDYSNFLFLSLQYQTELSIGNKKEDKYIGAYIRESAKWRKDNPPVIENYGSSKAETIRIFKAPQQGKKPLLINLKGGYWRIPGAEFVDFVAKGMNPHGISVMNIDYGTMPNITMEDIVNQISSAMRWIKDHADEYEIDTDNINIVGHSAGGHLAAVMKGKEEGKDIKNIFSVSGLYDLDFALHGHLSRGDRAIQLDPSDAQQYSPINMTPFGSGASFQLVGENETSEFHRQAKDLVKKWAPKNAKCECLSFPREDHYSLYYGLHDPNSRISKFIVNKIKN